MPGDALTAEPVSYPATRSHPLHPPDGLDRLREAEPLCRLRFADGNLGWLATGHELCRSILADPRFSVRHGSLAVGDPTQFSAMLETFDRYHMRDGNMLSQDPPLHTKLRRLQTRYFTLRAVNEHREVIERAVDECLDAMEASGPPVDFVEAFAEPVATTTASHLLGVNYGDHLDPDVSSADHGGSESATQAAFIERHFAYVRELIEERRRAPANDLISALVADEGFAERELPGAIVLMFAGAAESTTSQFALGMYALLSDETAWQALVARPTLVSNAVEELLRYVTVIQTTVRVALEEVELNGTTIAAGEAVTVSLESANRDPASFTDPDRVEVARNAGGHVGFGHGRHLCLGQHLARLELQVGLSHLVRRFPTLRLDHTAASAVEAEDVPGLRRVSKLPVAW